MPFIPINLPGADVTLFEDFLNTTTAAHFQAILEQTLPWRQRQVIIAGIGYDEPRLTSWHGKAYDLRENVEPLGYINVDEGTSDDSAAGGREGNAAPEHVPDEQEIAEQIDPEAATPTPDTVAPEEAPPEVTNNPGDSAEPVRYVKQDPTPSDTQAQSDKAENDVTKIPEQAKTNNRNQSLAAREIGATFDEDRKTQRGSLGDKGPGSDTPDVADDGDLGI
ncbi:MAG: hypothetical protein IPG54_15020 [Sphingomonadales bacterium]|nr:hypothetical protein [Sphingomonadales bacterium]